MDTVKKGAQHISYQAGRFLFSFEYALAALLDDVFDPGAGKYLSIAMSIIGQR